MKLGGSVSPNLLIIAGLTGVAIFLLYKAKGGASAALDAVNPNSRSNVVYGGVNSVGATLTGDQNFTLGGAVYDWWHDVPANQPGAAAVDLNPADSRNIVNRNFEAAGKAMTGDPDWTLGGWIYDVTHPA